MEQLFFLILIFIAATLYSSVGHGGASSYLAILALYGYAPHEMRTTALTMNIFVALISWLHLVKDKHFSFRLAWPFCVLSVPMAFFSAGLHVTNHVYYIVLGIFLILAVFRIVWFKNTEKSITNVKVLPALAIGAVIGFVSGFIGIGGGIILSPVILLFGWANIKQTAAISAFFIVINSISGLFGLGNFQLIFAPEYIYMIFAAIAGSVLGSQFTLRKGTPVVLKYLLSAVLLIAAIKLIFVH